MSKLNGLINELCPSGVAYKHIIDVLALPITDGPHETPRLIDEGIPFISVEAIHDGIVDITKARGFISKEYSDICRKKYKPEKDDIYMVKSASVGRVAMVSDDTEFDIWSPLAAMRCDKRIMMPRFLFHLLQTERIQKEVIKQSSTSSQPNLSMRKLEQFIIPVPPLEVQREIVRVLDSFTSLTTELTAKLTAELMARKKQYDYYGDILFSSDIPKESWKRVEKVIISLKTGLNPRQNFKLNTGGDKPYITGKDIYNNSINVSEKTDFIQDKDVELINKRACLEEGDVLFASTGTGTVGRMAVIEEYNHDWAVSETMFCLKPIKDIIIPHYLMYALYTQSARNQFEPKISKGSVPHLKVKDLLDVNIPVPTLKEQKRIITLMRRFDKICNDISNSLIAEIKDRQKQYEYYRNKILSFKEIGA